MEYQVSEKVSTKAMNYSKQYKLDYNKNFIEKIKNDETRRSLGEMIKQESKRQEERRQSETYFETKRKQDEWIRQDEFRRRQDERIRQEEFRRRQEEMIRQNEFRRRQEEMIRQENIMREQYMIRQEEMYIQEEMIREKEMIIRKNELRSRGLFMRRPYSAAIKPLIRSPIYPIAQMHNQMIEQPIYGRRGEFANRGVNYNYTVNQFNIYNFY